MKTNDQSRNRFINQHINKFELSAEYLQEHTDPLGAMVPPVYHCQSPGSKEIVRLPVSQHYENMI